MMQRVYVVLEHPDMTYYGDAEIHGVYSSEEAAKERFRQLDPDQSPEWSRYGVESWEVEDTVTPENVSKDN